MPVLSPKACLRHQQGYLCLFCGEAKHEVRACPAKMRKCPVMLPAHLSSMSAQATHLALLLSFQLQKEAVSVNTIIDSGAVVALLT